MTEQTGKPPGEEEEEEEEEKDWGIFLPKQG